MFIALFRNKFTNAENSGLFQIVNSPSTIEFPPIMAEIFFLHSHNKFRAFREICGFQCALNLYTEKSWEFIVCMQIQKSYEDPALNINEYGHVCFSHSTESSIDRVFFFIYHLVLVTVNNPEKCKNQLMKNSNYSQGKQT